MLEHFVEWPGQSVRSVKPTFKTAVRLAKLAGNVTPHTLGHTAATWLQHIDRRATKATVASRARLYLKAPFLHRQTLDGAEDQILHHKTDHDDGDGEQTAKHAWDVERIPLLEDVPASGWRLRGTRR